MKPLAEHAYFVIADISGYTGYLVGSDIEHAHDILADLVETVVGALRPIFRLAKLEGDAAFTVAPDGTLDGSMLLDTIDGCYFAFRRRLRSIQQATTCNCSACSAIPTLNLKFVTHFGECVRHRIAGRDELSGTGVILAHRLLKNRVTEAFGTGAYALLTSACCTAAGLDPEALDLPPHRETYEHIGEVQGFVHDLHARWMHEQEQRRVVITPANAELEAQALLPAPPALVWHCLTDPGKRVRFWPGMDRFDQQPVTGRRGIGTVNHCVHGRDTIIEEIVDWRPFEYFTVRATVPGFGPVTYMFDLVPEGPATLFTFRLDRIRRKKQRAAWTTAGPAFRATGEQVVAGLVRLVQEEMAIRDPGLTVDS
ncbi:MAG: DUF2652 domain-containing protein [Armatimonadota bacterium]|nr:DUF2652 domain-containing protein [Armatimonadota bacterium]